MSAPRFDARLKAALERGRLPHGILFHGPSGAPLKEVALALAQALLCPAPSSPAVPCGACAGCRQASAAAHADLHIVALEEGRKSIRIDDVRFMIGRASLRPLQAPRKVFIVESSEALGEDAQNALLKVLEEPPGSTVFILLSSAPEQLLGTVRSRLQAFGFASESAADEEDPEVEKLVKAALTYVAARAAGRPVQPPDVPRLEREAALALMARLSAVYRDALVRRSGAPDLASGADATAAENLANTLGPDALADALGAVGEARERLAHSVNARLVLPVLWEALEAAHGR